MQEALKKMEIAQGNKGDAFAAVTGQLGESLAKLEAARAANYAELSGGLQATNAALAKQWEDTTSAIQVRPEPPPPPPHPSPTLAPWSTLLFWNPCPPSFLFPPARGGGESAPPPLLLPPTGVAR